MFMLLRRKSKLRRFALSMTALFFFFRMAGSFLSAEPEPDLSRRSTIPDLVLINQDAENVRLYSDLMKGRVAAISFIFTTCPTICRSIGVNLSKLQTELGPSLGKEITLISITIDPEKDTPEELKKWGEQFGAGAGWSLLTGTRRNIDELLKKLEVFTSDIQTHTPFMLIVDDRTGQWTRVNVLATPPPKIAEMLRKLARGDHE
jgi:protein SCO1/2